MTNTYLVKILLIAAGFATYEFEGGDVTGVSDAKWFPNAKEREVWEITLENTKFIKTRKLF